MKSMISQLKQALNRNNIALDAVSCEKLVHYLNAMLKWNKVFNLTSITHRDDMIYLHFIDSLLIAPYIHGKTCLDVGTGAGLPGIPLAIMLPETKWVLLDKAGKKARFLLQMQVELGLNNISIAESRVEQFHPDIRFDSIVSRAFGSLRLLTESTHHLLANEGRWLLMKGKYPEDELNDVPSFVKVDQVIAIHMQGRTIERHLVNCIRG